jgi:hypothetical protein
MQIAFNSGQHPKEVMIFNPFTKEKASVFLQPYARVKLQEGFSVDEQFQRENTEISSRGLEDFNKEAKRLSDPNSYFKAEVPRDLSIQANAQLSNKKGS